MNRILIIGVQQFMGFHLCSRFLEEGCSVDGVFFQPEHPFFHKWVEEQMLWLGRNAELTIWSLEDLEQNMDASSYDYIYYCQLDPHDPEWPKDWFKEKEKLERTTNAIKGASCPIIFISSFDVYGEKQKIVTEKEKAIPSSEKGKLYERAEKWWESHMENNRGLSIIVRIPTVYGPWQPPGQWITDDLLKELHFKSMTRTSEKSPVRDLLYIEEAVNGLVELAKDVSLSSSIMHFVSDGFLEKLPKTASFPVDPINLKLKNKIVIAQKRDFQECYEEQRNFIQRFNPYMQNTNK